MRKDASRAFQKSAIRTIAAVLLAGVASGCSSDVSRFAGYLSSSDNITTASIGQKTAPADIRRPAPPQAVTNGVQSSVVASSSGLSDPLNQPMPAASGSTGNIYDPVRTGSVVSRQQLSSPTTTASIRQPLPAERPISQPSATVVMPDPVMTGSTPSKHVLKAPSASDEKRKVALNAPMPKPKKAPVRNDAVIPKAPNIRTSESADKGTSSFDGKVYKVQAGDSLGRIAANHNTSVAALREANGLNSDNIRIGQMLKVPGSAPARVKTVSTDKPVDKVTTASTPKEYTPPVKKVSVEQAEKETKVAAVAPKTTGIDKYRWPALGAIIAGYGTDVDGERNDGIDISLPEGSEVKAAENGVVIYSGDGLKKLGNTVLVRHADGKVTVYAHLKTLKVQRGDNVRRGQEIASSGMTGSASRPKLHFEVRKDSVPVNPMTFLE